MSRVARHPRSITEGCTPIPIPPCTLPRITQRLAPSPPLTVNSTLPLSAMPHVVVQSTCLPGEAPQVHVAHTISGCRSSCYPCGSPLAPPPYFSYRYYYLLFALLILCFPRCPARYQVVVQRAGFPAEALQALRFLVADDQQAAAGGACVCSDAVAGTK